MYDDMPMQHTVKYLHPEHEITLDYYNESPYIPYVGSRVCINAEHCGIVRDVTTFIIHRKHVHIDVVLDTMV